MHPILISSGFPYAGPIMLYYSIESSTPWKCCFMNIFRPFGNKIFDLSNMRVFYVEVYGAFLTEIVKEKSMSLRSVIEVHFF